MNYAAPPSELIVRRPIREDAAAIAALHIRSWQSAYNGLLSAAYLNALDATAGRRVNFLTNAIADGKPSIRVAELKGRLVGWSSFGLSRDDDANAETAELMAIYLDPQVWNQGIGTALWVDVQNAMRVEGFAHVTAWVLDGNERARRFYLKQGFTAQAASQRVVEEDKQAFPLTRYGLTLGDRE